MKIHEYQAKEIFRRFGVPTPRGEMVTKADDARGVAERLGTKVVVVKAQIHAGGRGRPSRCRPEITPRILAPGACTPIPTSPVAAIVMRTAVLVRKWIGIAGIAVIINLSPLTTINSPALVKGKPPRLPETEEP